MNPLQQLRKLLARSEQRPRTARIVRVEGGKVYAVSDGRSVAYDRPAGQSLREGDIVSVKGDRIAGKKTGRRAKVYRV